MRNAPYLLPALLLLALSCSKPDAAQPAADLTGAWAGTTTVEQAGNCQWGSSPTLTTSATWQVTGNAVSGMVIQREGTQTAQLNLTGTLTGNKMSLSSPQLGGCNGVSRTYTVRYEGEVNGKAVTIMGLDTICPTLRCIFRRTITLTRQ